MKVVLRVVAVAALLMLFAVCDGIAADEASVAQPRNQDIMESLRGLLSLLQDLVARLLLFCPRCLCTNPIEMMRLII